MKFDDYNYAFLNKIVFQLRKDSPTNKKHANDDHDDESDSDDEININNDDNFKLNEAVLRQQDEYQE